MQIFLFLKKSNNIKDFSEDSDFFEDFIPYQRTGRIIHQSTEQSYDDKGNKVTKTKIVREIEDSSNSKQNYKEIKISNNKRKNKIEPSILFSYLDSLFPFLFTYSYFSFVEYSPIFFPFIFLDSYT